MVRHGIAVGIVLGLIVVSFGGGTNRAVAQSGPANPADETINKRPYVLILMDSSASMEWTDSGAGQYPSRTESFAAFDGQSDPFPSQPDNYRPGYGMGIADGGDSDVDASRPNSDPLMFGSCYVWEPPCSSYERPSWDADNYGWTPAYNNSMSQRLGDMRETTGDKPVRLMNFSQPRHVTFKEILTGEMVLGTNSSTPPTQLNWQRYGPGCWFVPRQRGAAYIDDPVCCRNEKTITQPDGSTETICEDGFSEYDQFPDHNDPRPHIQEVFDDQIDNGLMDNMQGQVHFAVTSFDSYKFPMDGTTHSTNASDEEETVSWGPNYLSDPYTSQGTETPYNLGVYRVVGPHTFPNKESDVQAVNRMAQKVLRDSGTLKEEAWSGGSADPSFEVGPVGTYADAEALSRQPIAKNTPLAPAVHDIHDYFLSSKGPLYNDPYNGKGCRRKHAILMTDGLPLPEAPPASGQCVEIGQEGLSEAFNINPSEYDYSCTEREISDFVNDSNIYMQNGGTSDGLPARAHVVGINQTDWSKNWPNGSTSKPDRIRKLASMAVAGKTCAGWYLGNRTDSEEKACGTVGTTAGKGPWIPDFGSGTPGYCRRPEHPCLVKQYPNSTVSSVPGSFSSFGAPDKCPPAGWNGCEYPAVILTCNTVAQNKAAGLSDAEARAAFRECRSGKWSAKALQQIFNSIVGASGVASRTKAAVTNELDDPTTRGQYRLYSGVRVESGHPMWRGVLFRETRECGTTLESVPESAKDDPCEASNDVYQCFHEEVGAKIERDGTTGEATQDNRRIFTSVPSPRVWNYENGVGNELSSAPIDNACGLFHSNFYLQAEHKDRGEFQRSYLDQDGGSHDLLLHRRIPFSWETLKGALVGDGNDDWPLGDDNTADGDNSAKETLYSYLNTSSNAAAKKLIESVRGQTVARERRELAAILHSNPVTVEPPKRDVPIESYRDFKERFQYRPTMMYFSTMDGLLHAMYTGVLEPGSSPSSGSSNAIGVKQRTGMQTTEGEVFSNDPYSKLGSSGHETTGAATEQREAWAYLPHMLHDDLSGNFAGKNPNLMDGSPTVKNVRLCHENPKNNQNMQACNVSSTGTANLGGTCSSASSGSSNQVPDAEQWRTVLVQGLGQAGSGYFAVDVTRPGGSANARDGEIERPDPVPLWEFDPYWERGQVEQLVDGGSTFPSNGESLVCPPGSAGGCGRTPNTDALNSCGSAEDFWQQSFMGTSVSKPAVGTVVLPPIGNTGEPMRRPVAVFGAGGSASGAPGCSGGEQLGEAVYVVDLQTGSILRRFTGYWEDGSWHEFETELVGAPAVYSNQPGRLTSRAFIGDSDGRMFRIEFKSGGTNQVAWDPANWRLDLFMDPAQESEIDKSAMGTSPVEFGAAQLKPAVARNSNDNLVVVYGLGSPSDTASENLAHAILAVRELPNAPSGTDPSELLWHVGSDQTGGFELAEKVTGAPVIFNNAAYFTSYARNDTNVCRRGTSRVWGVDFAFDASGSGGSLPTGVFNCAENPDLDNCGSTDSNGFSRFFEPAKDAVVQGLTISLGPACSTTGGASGAYGQLTGEDDQQPQLIVQTGGTDATSSSGGGGGSGGSGGSSGSSGSGDFVHRKSVGIRESQDQTVPMSWSVVN